MDLATVLSGIAVIVFLIAAWLDKSLIALGLAFVAGALFLYFK